MFNLIYFQLFSEAVKKAWDKKKSLTDNLTSMGLVADPNTMHKLKIPSGKASIILSID